MHGRIVLQPMFMCLMCFSAAAIAKAELLCGDTGDDRNREKFSMRVVLHPVRVRDEVRAMLYAMNNVGRWQQLPEFGAWIKQCRLYYFRHTSRAARARLLLRMPTMLLHLEECGETMNRICKQHDPDFAYVPLLPGVKPGSMKSRGRIAVSVLVTVGGLVWYVVYSAIL